MPEAIDDDSEVVLVIKKSLVPLKSGRSSFKPIPHLRRSKEASLWIIIYRSNLRISSSNKVIRS